MIRSHPHLILSGLWGQEVCFEGHNQAEQSHGTQVPSRSSATVSHHSPQCQDQGGVFWFLIFKAVAKYKLGALGTDPCCTRPLQWLLAGDAPRSPAPHTSTPKSSPSFPSTQPSPAPTAGAGGEEELSATSGEGLGCSPAPARRYLHREELLLGQGGG